MVLWIVWILLLLPSNHSLLSGRTRIEPHFPSVRNHISLHHTPSHRHVDHAQPTVTRWVLSHGAVPLRLCYQSHFYPPHHRPPFLPAAPPQQTHGPPVTPHNIPLSLRWSSSLPASTSCSGYSLQSACSSPIQRSFWDRRRWVHTLVL